MAKLSIENVDVAGKRVLTRVDFNVPLTEDCQVADDQRIQAALPTIKNIVDRGGKLILMSHLGRPKGEGYEENLSLQPIATHLGTLLDKPVKFVAHDCVGDDVTSAIKAMNDGDIMLLENLRFHTAETVNDLEFAAKLANFADVYCNDAFGTAHRSHASMVAVPNALGDAPKACGFLLAKELKYLREVLDNPERPFVAILGGAKVSDKIGAIENLILKVDTILIGGAMAYTFLMAMERRVGKSLVEHNKVKEAHHLLELAAEHECQLFVPSDHVCGKEISEFSSIRIFSEHIEDGWMGLDIGPKTQVDFWSKIRDAKTIVWNGPVGAFEVGPFEVGTACIAQAIAEATANGATSIIGGGDSAAAINKFGFGDRFSHISTGGGASLRMLEGKELPGIGALTEV